MSGKEEMRMNEVRAYHETAGRIEVYTDTGGRILITCMPIVEEKEVLIPTTIFLKMHS